MWMRQSKRRMRRLVRGRKRPCGTAGSFSPAPRRWFAGTISDWQSLLTREQGKPLHESIDEVRGCANILEYYASIAGQPPGETVNLGKAGDCLVTRVPLGVCGAIIPWNMPVLIMGWKVGPALLAGNSLVLKPASTTPLTNLKIAGLLQEAGLPAGVLNVVTGTGEMVGEALVSHAKIKKISFTGNCATGGTGYARSPAIILRHSRWSWEAPTR